jgi:hypothetical protein
MKTNGPPTQPASHSLLAVLLLLLAFSFRLAFGLCSDIDFIDERQIYLIGLKFATTGLWPYFGPDVTYHMQIPGALQGLVVGLPLKVLPLPEAPYFFLNLLSFAALCLLAWYFSKRLPHFPRWLLWGWLMTAPWVLNCSTHIFNVSYVLFGSVLFFVGFLETMPSLTLGLLSPGLGNFMMGFALLWNAQFHLSTAILLPYVLVSFYFQVRVRPQALWNSIPYFLLGGLVTGAFLIPTYWRYGFEVGTGGTQHALVFNPANILSFFTILARYFSLASCEVPRFLGAHTAERLEVLKLHPWAVPFTAVAFLLGLIQPVVMLLAGFRRGQAEKDWPAVKALAWVTFLLIYVSFLFAFKVPAAHTYYVTLPVVMLYALHVFSPWVSRPWFLVTAKVLLACNLLFAICLAIHTFQTKSLYRERPLFVKAIQSGDYRLLGERRPGTLY